MIIKEFAKYVQSINADVPAVVLLSGWIRDRISRESEDTVDKVIQKELAYMKNKRGLFLLFGRSDSGRQLLESLYEYALCYDSHRFSKWVHNVKASDFK